MLININGEKIKVDGIGISLDNDRAFFNVIQINENTIRVVSVTMKLEILSGYIENQVKMHLTRRTL